jgi:putative adhesin
MAAGGVESMRAITQRIRMTIAAAGVVALAACDLSLGHLAGRATEEWTHTYPLTPRGEVRVGNTNGRVEIEPADGAAVEIRAEKIARAATDAGARELLPRIRIREDAKPDRVEVETESIAGLLLGAGYEVRYHVKVPKGAVLDVTTTNGTITMRNVANRITARTTNGGVRATGLSGQVDAQSTNGTVNVELASIADRVSLRTTNGSVVLGVPDDAKADINASWTNGGIHVSDVKVEIVERSRRSFEGKMNGGGAPIELHTTNGSIRIRSSRAATADTDDSKS